MLRFNKVLPVRLKVFFAQASGSSYKQTVFYETDCLIIVLRNAIFRPVDKRFLKVVLSYMFSLRFHQFKILYSVIASYVVNMMYLFAGQQFAPKVLFHNMAVLKNPLTINPYSVISIISEVRLTLPKHCPVWGYIKITVSGVPRPMHATYLAFNRSILTMFNPTNFHYPYNIELCL